MSRDYEKEIAEQERIQRESHLRVNKFMAERDPLYEHRYQEKRGILVDRIRNVEYEISRIEEKLNAKRDEKKELDDQLKALDEARKNWEPMGSIKGVP